MKKIVSFGDSFVWGTEIPNNDDGMLAWAGLVSKDLGCDYETRAEPGCGNDAIARQIYSYFYTHTRENTLAVINWTWTMRWDFYLAEQGSWITLGPSCVPEKLSSLLDKTQSHRLVEFYQDYANSSLLWNKTRNLQTILAVQHYLDTRGITNIQTYMDYHLFETQWCAPDYVKEMQNLVRPRMRDWDGSNFIDWCRQRGHEITEAGLHPLLDAHKDAAKFWKDKYDQALA